MRSRLRRASARIGRMPAAGASVVAES
jgi:hypothetical protein